MVKATALSLIVLVFGTLSADIAQAKENTQREKRINRYLANTPMRGIAPILEKEGRKYNVSPYFIVAVSGKESSHGYRACAENKLNVWGLGACGRAWNAPKFENWTQAVNFFVRFIRGKAGVSSGWPNADNVYDFYGYCKGCETDWFKGVMGFMYKLGVGSKITY